MPGEFHGLGEPGGQQVHGVAKRQTQLSDFHFTVFRGLTPDLRNQHISGKKDQHGTAVLEYRLLSKTSWA